MLNTKQGRFLMAPLVLLCFNAGGDFSKAPTFPPVRSLQHPLSSPAGLPSSVTLFNMCLDGFLTSCANLPCRNAIPRISFFRCNFSGPAPSFLFSVSSYPSLPCNNLVPQKPEIQPFPRLPPPLDDLFRPRRPPYDFDPLRNPAMK